MKNPTLIALLWLVATLLLCCNNSKKDNIIFRYQDHIVVDFKNKKIEVSMIKYKGVLELSKEEENTIYSAFNKNGITKLKGEVFVSDSLPITPIIVSEFKIYHEGTLKSTVFINEGYEKHQNAFNEEHRIADFRDVVKKVLAKNRSFKLAKDSLERYKKQRNLFNL